MAVSCYDFFQARLQKDLCLSARLATVIDDEPVAYVGLPQKGEVDEGYAHRHDTEYK